MGTAAAASSLRERGPELRIGIEPVPDRLSCFSVVVLVDDHVLDLAILLVRQPEFAHAVGNLGKPAGELMVGGQVECLRLPESQFRVLQVLNRIRGVSPVGTPQRDDDVFFVIDGITEFSKQDRKSTRLNSSHVAISYAVFCLKKKNK